MDINKLTFNASVIAAICNSHDSVIFWQLMAIAAINLVMTFVPSRNDEQK